VRIYIFLLIFLIIIGCGVEIKDVSENVDLPVPTKCVNIFTLAPVNDALVTDANNQVAKFDINSGYCFDNDIVYPVTAKATSETYVDIDYDGVKTAVDLKPNSLLESGIKSFCSNINFLTSLYYSSYFDSNITVDNFTNSVKSGFNIDICQDPRENEDNAKVLFGAYNYIADNEKMFEKIEDIEEEVNRVNNFFNTYLISNNNRIKYYSAYNSLIQLDEKKVQRADTTHKPDTPLVLGKNLDLKTVRYENENNSLDVFDILTYNENSSIFLAIGHDGFAEMSKTNFSSLYFSNNVDLESFGLRLSNQSYSGKECLFLANSKGGLQVYDINLSKYPSFTKVGNILEYYNDVSELKKFSDISIVNSNGYVSANENKRLLGIATSDKGYYLLNIKESFDGCTPLEVNMTVNDGGVDVNKTVVDINETRDFLINEGGGYAVDAVFRDDGTYLYVSHKEGGISGYRTDILDSTIISNSKQDIVLQNSAEAYNLKLFNNDNELVVTTNEGIQIYDVQGDNSLIFISSYKSEGAQTNYFQILDLYEDYIIFTDSYRGVKVLKLDNSFKPMLCGVEYFAPKDRPYELAKVESVKHYIDENGDVNLLVGVSSYGIVKFKLNDILFQHCK
jgi:hypothetical protein